MRYHLTQIRIATIQKRNREKISVSEDVDKLEPLLAACGNIK